MNNFMKYLLFSLSILLFFFGCICSDKMLNCNVFSVQNISDSAIYVYITCNDSLPRFPKLNLFDTILENKSGEMKGTIISPDYRINAFSYYTNKDNHVGDILFERNCQKCKGKTLKLFFIKENTMRTKGWEDIYKKQLYEKRISLSIEQILAFNLTVKYIGRNTSDVW